MHLLLNKPKIPYRDDSSWIILYTEFILTRLTAPYLRFLPSQLSAWPTLLSFSDL